MSLPYGAPVMVSPLIRGARFGLLFAGIIYGVIKQGMYSRIDAFYKEEEAKKKIIRDKELEILKQKIANEEAEAVRKFEEGQLF